VSSARPVQRSAARAWMLGALAVGTTVLAFPPFGLWPLALVAAWPATALVLDAPTPRAAALRGWLYGVGVLGLGTAWLAETLVLNLVLVALAGAMWHAAWGWAARRVLPTAPMMVALPLLWVAQEMCRLHWPLGGYPWMALGHALAASPVLVQAADLGGVLMLTGLAAVVAAGFRSASRRERRGSTAAGVLLLAAAAYGLLRPGTLDAPRPGPRLASIQPAFPQQLKIHPLTWEQIYAPCMQLSRLALAAQPPPDVLVWPETMWPLPLGDAAPEIQPGNPQSVSTKAMAPLLAGGKQLVLGSLWWHAPDARGLHRAANRALVFTPEGRITGVHDKVLLVPGGEAVPFGDLLPDGAREAVVDWIARTAGFVADLKPGTGYEPLEVGGVPCGVTICFENAYGEPGRESVRRGAAFLLNLSNEAWFGTSAEHDQMELHSVLRSVETRRALFRSTNSGITCLVRPDGHPPEGADRFTVDGVDRAVSGVFSAQVPLHDGLTLYVRWGEWIGWVGLLGTALLLFLHRPGRPS
jgi:apolipoprotein N-acyltransferase